MIREEVRICGCMTANGRMDACMNPEEHCPMPENFKYKEVFERGRPRHDADDPFFIRHPRMDLSRRAKLFAPFDALRGFSAAVIAKNEQYEARREMDSGVMEELNEKISLLHRLTRTKKTAIENNVQIAVTCFVPCADDTDAFSGPCADDTGSSSEPCGKYHTFTGTCMGVDPEVTRTLLLDELRISFEDIIRIDM